MNSTWSPPQPLSPTLPSRRLSPLATLTPPSSARTWQSAPHPALPVLATACADRTVRLYSLQNFTLIDTISGGHKRSVRAVAWKPGSGEVIADKQGRRKRRRESVLATGSFDASAGIWRRAEGVAASARDDDNDGEDGDEPGAGTMDLDNGPQDLEADFTSLNAADGDDSGWSFSVVLDGHESEIKSLSWSAGGQFLATCARDKTVWIWEELDEDNFETAAVLAEHDGDVKCVAWHPAEELLASASYDDTIRLYKEDFDDWTCVCVLESHGSTVWCVDWEPVENPSLVVTERSATPSGSDGHSKDKDSASSSSFAAAKQALLSTRAETGPRLISCSADVTIRVWSRRRKPPSDAQSGRRFPSILRSSSVDEEWVEEAQLPRSHDRAIYAVSWSKRTGLVVSAGSDGRIVVYQEIWQPSSTAGSDSEDIKGSVAAPGSKDEGSGSNEQLENGDPRSTAANDSAGPVEQQASTQWVVIAEMDAAHGVFEVNHVCWARRWDSGRRQDEEEIIVSTGDDGEVKTWTLEESNCLADDTHTE